jgi:hypothetical protein
VFSESYRWLSMCTTCFEDSTCGGDLLSAFAPAEGIKSQETKVGWSGAVDGGGGIEALRRSTGTRIRWTVDRFRYYIFSSTIGESRIGEVYELYLIESRRRVEGRWIGNCVQMPYNYRRRNLYCRSLYYCMRTMANAYDAINRIV